MDKTIEITESGQKVIVTMRNMLSNVRSAIGDTDPLYVRMAESLAFSLSQMINLGGWISGDGDDSLICRNDYITYGVNFHRKTHTSPEIADFPMVKQNLGEWSVNS